MTTLSVQPENRALNFIIKTDDLTDKSIVRDNERLSEAHNNSLVISSTHISSENKEFECWICKSIFRSPNEFSLHLRSHNNSFDCVSPNSKTRFSCKFCHKVLGSANSLDRHILIHTGERPFKCEFCSLTFTTNGNMHRHVRVNHQHQNMKSLMEDYWSHDSNESNDSYEDQNCDLSEREGKKMKFSDSEFNNNNTSNTIDNNNSDEKYATDFRPFDNFTCPVCCKNEKSLHDLEEHISEVHPDYQARCDKCNLLFQNHQVLKLHVFMVHHKEEAYKKKSGKNMSVPDLTGLIHESRILSQVSKSPSHEFKCEKCFSNFSNSVDLETHQKNCTVSDVDSSSNENYSATDLNSVNSKRKHTECSADDEKKRKEFFTGLDLKTVDHTPTKSMPSGAENKDLADIQSIITNTSTTHLITDLSKSPEPNSVSPIDSGCGEEEQQDCFAAEFRKMKLRGEFPCRLCSSIFPNLRALKGHNRVHLNSSPGSLNNPYRCNMCPHSSTDKSALLRHMRTHNGDRPYECSICRYAFTTKANCERHLRNRHSKVTREDVKKAIIYHPSEDSTNDLSDQSNYYPKEEVRKSLFSETLKDSINLLKNRVRLNSTVTDKIKHSVPIERSESIKSNSSILNCSMNSSDWLDESSERKGLDVSMTSDDEEEEEDVKLESSEQINNDEKPLDLSVDVLDLSKKKSPLNIKLEEEEPQDLSKKTPEVVNTFDSSPTPSNVVTNGFQNAEELTDQNSAEPLTQQVYRNNLIQMYEYEKRPVAPSLSTAFHPYYFPTPILPIGFQPNINVGKDDFQKEVFRGMQLNSRGVIDQLAMASAAERIHAIQHQALVEYNKRIENVKSKGRHSPMDHSVISTQNNNLNIANNNNNIENLTLKNQSNSSASVKMVLKDGVLQAKPKQRRYRTERPFFCEHCSGRFTLRSNMERHIKQQHPQFWIQKQRGGSSGTRRGHPYNKLLPMVPGFNHASNPPSCYEEANHYIKALPNFVNNDGIKSISDEVKIAISLQLKNKVISCEENAKYYADIKSSDSSPERLDSADDKMDSHRENLSNANYRGHERHEDTGNEGYEDEDEEEEELIIDETIVDYSDPSNTVHNDEEEDRKEERKEPSVKCKEENGVLDLASVSRLLDNASTQTFRQFFHDEEEHNQELASEEDEEGLVAGSEGNASGSDENRSESEQNTNSTNAQPKKKSAYSLAPNRVFCPYCDRKFPWSSSLRRHILTHTGQKPYKCSHCPLLFTTKSNCDRHLLRKHSGQSLPPVEVSLAENLDNQSFSMRNVPERPYKCTYCPSSTFATVQNLHKHISCKHSDEKKSEDVNSGYEESHGSGSEDIEVADKKFPTTDNHSPSDLPFKCYLCEESHAERQEALEHIKSEHFSEFQLLMSKGALDTNASSVPEESSHNDEMNTSEENLEQLKGKFPDYANRKVMCAFCMRRFWSAEDLRRHMRTHTGERPFSCDICRRKFTLKHSMLRHQKKHIKLSNSEDNFNSDDDSPGQSTYINNNNSIINFPVSFWARREQEGSDLISNLLGIHDKTIIDKMLLSKSAEDAARLLGVQK